ncbi:MAG: zf-HC2 domain-containing protein [Blautia sp.]|nr:zf-HC2 domain-containing protein [Lachnoclostridium sp.]MCM1210305.1 zf-HC2 domain-containing protein [Blautia sp.]
MDRELACEIVRDLLPLYVDNMVSDVSKESIESHLEQCADCNEIYQNMAFKLETETQTTEVSDVKRFLKKTKKMYLLYGLGILSLIAIFICIIVDLAVNKKITWSFITGTSCLFADSFIYVLATCRKNKICIAMTVISIGTFCLLSTIQITRYYLMGTGTFWIFRYGLPILLLWLVILWIPALMGTFLKCNIWDCIALFLFLVILGNYVTKLITGDYVWDDVLHMQNFIGNALGEVIGILLFVIIGRIRKWKK